MDYTQVHDYLIKNEHNLSAHHLHFLAWLKAHANFLVGIEKYFLMLRDELSEFVHKENTVVNKELIDDYANKSHFNLLENIEHKVLQDIKMFRKMLTRAPHDLFILDYLGQLETHCSFLQKYIRPELASC
ncbi:MAG: hypothetical protein WC755_06125 [Candidatus Woesearchaeota archaeon]|jgi:hypothetical protein